AYRLILQDNNIEMACCAHCGLIRHQQLADQVVQAICHDFLKSTTISVANASYVMDTSIDIGCCQPQVLTFEQKDHAEKFVRGFGGNVYCFKEAMYLINEKNERVSSQTLVPILYPFNCLCVRFSMTFCIRYKKIIYFKNGTASLYQTVLMKESCSLKYNGYRFLKKLPRFYEFVA